MKQLLTGKCLDDFETYCKDKYDSDDYIIVNGFGDRTTFYSIITWYEKCPVEMQWGVIQAFGDSVEIPLLVKHVNNYVYGVTYDCWVYGFGWEEHFKTRSQAQEQAIKHFNRMYNEK